MTLVGASKCCPAKSERTIRTHPGISAVCVEKFQLPRCVGVLDCLAVIRVHGTHLAMSNLRPVTQMACSGSIGGLGRLMIRDLRLRFAKRLFGQVDNYVSVFCDRQLFQLSGHVGVYAGSSASRGPNPLYRYRPYIRRPFGAPRLDRPVHAGQRSRRGQCSGVKRATDAPTDLSLPRNSAIPIAV